VDASGPIGRAQGVLVRLRPLGFGATAFAGLPNRSALGAKAGGAEGNRTPDLLIANEALYHLSYGPQGKPRKARNNPFEPGSVKRARSRPQRVARSVAAKAQPCQSRKAG
jgi:hypothetical protein